MSDKAAALAFHLDAARRSLDALLDETAGMDEGTTPEEVAQLQYALRRAVIDTAKKIDAALTVSITQRWAPSQRPHIIDGLPPVVIRRTAKSIKWPEPARTAAAVIDAHIEREHPDGDFPAPWEVSRWLLDAAAVSYWRVTDLRALNIDPDEHRVIERGNLVVDYG